MKFGLVGAGAAGGRIVDRMHGLEGTRERTFSEGNAFVFDTSPEAFEEYASVPADRQILLGDTHPDVRGEGTGGDIDTGADVAREESNEIYREFDGVETNALDAILLVAGLGGGTGGGVGPVLLEHLQSIYEVPVYALGILPHDGEGDGRALNAARSLPSFVSEAENVLLFDNDAWHTGEGSLEERYPELNDELTRRVVSALAAGELDGASVAENRIDSSDIMRALGTGGVSSVGYASTDIGTDTGLLAWLRSLLGTDQEEEETDAARTNSLVRRAVNSRLTLPCEIASAERVLVVLSGPPSACSRRGFESARYWLEEEADTVEVLAGDQPRPGSSRLAASVILSNVTEVPRVDELQSRAVAFQTGE
jgi:cell division GTPase FtsZ